MTREIQTGLYMEVITVSAGSYIKLYSSEGYCFYDRTRKYYDENNNLIPEENITPQQRLYSIVCYTPMATIEELNARFVSVVREDFMNVLSNPNNDHEVA